MESQTSPTHPSEDHHGHHDDDGDDHEDHDQVNHDAGDHGAYDDGDIHAHVEVLNYLQVVKPKGSLLVVAKAELPSKNIQGVPEIGKIKSNKICVPKLHTMCPQICQKSKNMCKKIFVKSSTKRVPGFLK